MRSRTDRPAYGIDKGIVVSGIPQQESSGKASGAYPAGARAGVYIDGRNWKIRSAALKPSWRHPFLHRRREELIFLTRRPSPGPVFTSQTERRFGGPPPHPSGVVSESCDAARVQAIQDCGGAHVMVAAAAAMNFPLG